MAYYTKYRAEFKDILEETWRVDIQEVAVEQGTITEFKCTGTPLTVEWYNSDDIYTQNIVGSKVSLNIWSDTDFSLTELYTSDNLQFKVIVYHDTTPYWSGFILAESYQEPYDGVPISTIIVATDGLGILKDFNFVDLGYTTRQKFSVVIYDILSLVGITTFTEYINLYDANMVSTVDDSPLDQLGLDPDLFIADNCYDALTAILKLFNAGIRQDQNIVTIYRFNETAGATMYGRVFTSGTAKSSISKSTTQYIDRPTQASPFIGVDGGTLTMLPQARKYIINYDFGLKESCLKHWDFQFDDFTSASGVYSIDNWTTNNVIIKPFSLLIPGEDLGIHLDYLTQYASNQNITQVLEGVKTRSPKFKLSLEYRIHNKTLDPLTRDFHVVVYLVGDADTKYWDEDAQEWNTNVLSKIHLFTGDVPAGWNKWESIDILIEGIPNDGDLYVKLYSANDTTNDTTLSYRNIRLLMTPAEGDSKTGVGYDITCANTGRIIEDDVTLGDGFTAPRYTVNQLLNYNGIVNDYSSGVIIDPSLVWHTRGNTENKVILELIGEELGTQYESYRQLIDLPMYEMASGSYLSSIGNLVDVINVDKVFYPAISTFDVRERKHQLVLTEIL